MVDETQKAVHTPIMLADPDEIQKCLAYHEELSKAFFKIGAEIAKSTCLCTEGATYVCGRCNLVKAFADKRRHLSLFQETFNVKKEHQNT